MTAGHDELHTLAGAFVLGGLDEADYQAFSTHLRDCAMCQREIGQISGLPRLLDLVEEPTEDPMASSVGEPGAVMVLLRRHRARRVRSRARWAAAAAMLAVGVAGAAGSWGQAQGRAQVQRELAASTMRATGTPATGTPAGSIPVAVQLDFVSKAWGTEVRVEASGLPSNEEFGLWVVDAVGQSTQVSTWKGTTSGRASLTAASSRELGEIHALEVRTTDGRLLAVARI